MPYSRKAFRGIASPVVVLASTRAGRPCAKGDDGLTVPESFCARAVAKALGPVRPLVDGPDGAVHVAAEKGGTTWRIRTR